MKKRQGSILFKVLVYTVCIFLAILSLMPL